MSDDAPDFTHLRIMAGIGFVCVEWALLETLTLGTIATIEGLPLDKVYLIFGSLDMKPRLDMALNLAVAAKAPVPLQKRIKAVRTALHDEKLTEKRNQAIHGAHGVIPEPDAIELMMVRWNGTRRLQRVTTTELHQLGTRLNALAMEMDAIGTDIHAWKMRVLQNRVDHAQREFAIANTPVFLKVTKSLYASAKARWRNLKI